MKMNNADKWSWTEISNDEFNAHKLRETYYRIYHKVGEDNIVDYKFWAKNDEEALKILNEYKSEHDGEFYYSTSGYYLDSNNNRYDSMKEMHNAWKEEKEKSVYNDEDRKLDIEVINDFAKESFSEKRIDVIKKLNDEIDKLKKLIVSYETDAHSLVDKISSSDLNTLEEDEMDKIKHESYHLDDKFYDIEDNAYLLSTKHNRNEVWSLYDHIINDLKFNLKKMIDNKNLGCTMTYIKIASEKYNIAIDNVTYDAIDESQSEKLHEYAYQLWEDKLIEIYNHVLGYIYCSEFGIIDKNDEEMVKYDNEHKNEIPRVYGTDRQVDYKKLNDITMSHWNAIFDFLKTDGLNLWC